VHSELRTSAPEFVASSTVVRSVHPAFRADTETRERIPGFRDDRSGAVNPDKGSAYVGAGALLENLVSFLNLAHRQLSVNKVLGILYICSSRPLFGSAR